MVIVRGEPGDGVRHLLGGASGEFRDGGHRGQERRGALVVAGHAEASLHGSLAWRPSSRGWRGTLARRMQPARRRRPSPGADAFDPSSARGRGSRRRHRASTRAARASTKKLEDWALLGEPIPARRARRVRARARFAGPRRSRGRVRRGRERPKPDRARDVRRAARNPPAGAPQPLPLDPFRCGHLGPRYLLSTNQSAGFSHESRSSFEFRRSTFFLMRRARADEQLAE